MTKEPQLNSQILRNAKQRRKEVKFLLQENAIEQASQKLVAFAKDFSFKKNYINEAIVLRSKYNNLKKQLLRFGTTNENMINQDKLSFQVLDLIDEIYLSLQPIAELPNRLIDNEINFPSINEKSNSDDDPQFQSVFLCYSNTDKAKVSKLYKKLRSEEINVWYDEESLIPGQNWKYAIEKAIRLSQMVIICLSKGSINKKGFVQKEIKIALDIADEQPEGTIYLIPLKLEECQLPSRLSHLQCVDLYDGNGWDKLISVLRS